jgi:hypothetical protein
MKIERPNRRVIDAARRTVRLWFGGTGPASPDGYAGQEDISHPLDGEYYLRGGICWPVTVRVGSECAAVGFVLLIGQNIVTGKRLVFEERSFSCVDPIINTDGRIEFDGVASWFNQVWTSYACRDYYWHQDEQTHKAYLLQVIRSLMIEPKPQFIEVPWQDEEQVTPLYWKYLNTDRLKYKAAAHASSGDYAGQDGGELHGQLRQYQLAMGAEKIESFPAVLALMCALAGMERSPWRERKK